ncbi:hypothetical protein R3P38DRAFT_2792825 [Favolaschia claudopus]|uniref:Uncharacterized protein n=1 Tax=Favolaschia claudopus TaxID=2862362 RepID=A0AAW0AEI4_9AGAR
MRRPFIPSTPDNSKTVGPRHRPVSPEIRGNDIQPELLGMAATFRFPVSRGCFSATQSKGGILFAQKFCLASDELDILADIRIRLKEDQENFLRTTRLKSLRKKRNSARCPLKCTTQSVDELIPKLRSIWGEVEHDRLKSRTEDARENAQSHSTLSTGLRRLGTNTVSKGAQRSVRKPDNGYGSYPTEHINKRIFVVVRATFHRRRLARWEHDPYLLFTCTNEIR